MVNRKNRRDRGLFSSKDDVVLAMDRPWIEAGLKFAYLSQDDLPCLLVQRVSRLRARKT
jgi:type I restriction enzyme S subunit